CWNHEHFNLWFPIPSLSLSLSLSLALSLCVCVCVCVCVWLGGEPESLKNNTPPSKQPIAQHADGNHSGPCLFFKLSLNLQILPSSTSEQSSGESQEVEVE